MAMKCLTRDVPMLLTTPNCWDSYSLPRKDTGVLSLRAVQQIVLQNQKGSHLCFVFWPPFSTFLFTPQRFLNAGNVCQSVCSWHTWPVLFTPWWMVMFTLFQTAMAEHSFNTSINIVKGTSFACLNSVMFRHYVLCCLQFSTVSRKSVKEKKKKIWLIFTSS